MFGNASFCAFSVQKLCDKMRDCYLNFWEALGNNGTTSAYWHIFCTFAEKLDMPDVNGALQNNISSIMLSCELKQEIWGR